MTVPRAGSAFPWHVGLLPFNWGPLKQPTNGAPLPDLLPFALDLDPETFHLKQVPRAETRDALELAYKRGSQMTGMMDEAGIGLQYAEDFLRFLGGVAHTGDFKGARILEIGCGTGYLLHRLSVLGASVLGVEPGSHGQERASKYRVPMVRDFFPSRDIRGKFDLIVFYAVLEHFERPADFLGLLPAYLAPGGKIAMAVPNCEPYIESGDISMLLHEHWSYFSTDSLTAMLLRNGWSDIEVAPSGFGGCLYASARMERGAPSASSLPKHGARPLEAAAARFRDQAIAGAQKLKNLLATNARDGLSTGIFVPARAVNALVWTNADLSRCRFFDDNAQYHGCYFPGIPVMIEPREALIDKPTDSLVVMSHTFGRQIASQLRAVLPPGTSIVEWASIYGPGPDRRAQ